MLVPPTATFADFGLGVDLAFGRWDVTQRRSFRSGWHGRHERRGSGSGDLAPDRLVHGSAPRGQQFEYLYDDDEKWIHECVVEGYVARRETAGRAPIAVPILGWGTIPDQFGRLTPDEVETDVLGASADAPEVHDAPDAAGLADGARPVPGRARPGVGGKAGRGSAGSRAVTGAGDAGGRGSGRRHRGTAKPLDLAAVRAASRAEDVAELLSRIEGRDLGPALQQVGDALLRTYRSAGVPDQRRLAESLREVEALLGQRGWEGDDVLAEEIDALLSGSERRGRTLSVDIEELSQVMANGGDDPGGYLHLDTGEVVYAFLHHGLEDLAAAQPDVEDDNLWIYVDHDADAAYADMAAFAEAAPDRFGGILSVAIRGRGAFARFRRTVDELNLWSDWQVFSDDRAFGRARALLRAQGIRPL